jgi:hypothetical protein
MIWADYNGQGSVVLSRVNGLLAKWELPIYFGRDRSALCGSYRRCTPEYRCNCKCRDRVGPRVGPVPSCASRAVSRWTTATVVPLLSESGASSFSLFRLLVVKDTAASLAIAATLRKLSCQRHDASALGALPFPLSYLDANPMRQRITELIDLARLFPRLGCRRMRSGFFFTEGNLLLSARNHRRWQ